MKGDAALDAEVAGPSTVDPMAQRMAVAAAIDAAVGGPVLVIGSTPPHGRDLDLLADPDDHRRIAAWLTDSDFVRWHQTWALLDGSSPYAVELMSTDGWPGAGHDAAGLLRDAETLPGFRHLAQPAPATVLLLAARGTVTRRGGVTDKVRRRVADAVARDPEAWVVAERQARTLGMVGALRLLRQAVDRERPLPLTTRVLGLAGVLLGPGPLETRARVMAGARPRRLRPPIVSFSGLDGSGKSTQVYALQAGLEGLGVTTATHWGGAFKTGSKLRAALRTLDTAPLPVRAGAWGTDGAEPVDRMVPAGLAGHEIGRQVWAVYVALLNVVNLWGLVLTRRPGAKILLFDRFTPDLAVRLDLHYRCFRGWDTTLQQSLYRLLAPRPDVAFLVAVSGEVAYGRRHEQTLEELNTTAQLYDEHTARFGLVRLDGTRPAEELHRKVLAETWRRLP